MRSRGGGVNYMRSRGEGGGRGYIRSRGGEGGKNMRSRGRLGKLREVKREVGVIT